MELFEYLKYLYRYWKWMLVGVVAGGMIAGAIAYTAADSYLATVSIYVQRATDPANGQYFTYEGYYAQQTAAAYAKTALELLSNDEIIKRAADHAGLPIDASSISDIKGSITSTQEAPQLIKIAVVLPTKEEASALAEGLSEAVKNRTAEINQSGDAQLLIEQVDETPFVVLVRPLLWLFVAIGSVVGLILSMIIAAFWVYARHQNSKSKA